MFFSLTISWWKNTKLEHKLNALNIKTYKAFEIVKTPLNVGLRQIGVEKLLFFIVILLSKIEIISCSTSKVTLILGC